MTTAQEVLSAIKAEIEKKKKSLEDAPYAGPIQAEIHRVYRELLSSLDTLAVDASKTSFKTEVEDKANEWHHRGLCSENCDITIDEVEKTLWHFINIGWNEAYIKGREDAHKSAREVGLPKKYDYSSEVDLEKEIDSCWQSWLSPSNQSSVEGVLPKSEFSMYARHFYELGKNTK